MNKQYLIFILFLFSNVNAQISNSTFSRDYTLFNKLSDLDCHYAAKPYILSHLDSSFKDKSGSWLIRKFRYENFFQEDSEEYLLSVNPIINLEIGKEIKNSKVIWNNTRGIIVDGRLGEKFTFYSSFLENQSVFPMYITNKIIDRSWIVPGQGKSHWSNDSVFDYSIATGHFSYQISKFASLQFGTGKNFIGDGYRSMILSDNAFNYPFLKIQTKAGIFQYTNLYMEHMDLLSSPSEEYTYDKKYMTMHHLSANISNNLNIGIFEAIIWENVRNPEISGFDIAYLNPIIFLRPVEFSLNSSDNALLGANMRFDFLNDNYIYSQFVLDEFSGPSLNGNRWWGNKYSYQFGIRSFNLFDLNNLVFQFENNFSRPYTYSHSFPSQNYGHYYQSLAHPLGSNFNEYIVFLDYKYRKWILQYQFLYAKYGDKFRNDPTSYGNNIFISNTLRPSDYGILMFQGNETDLVYQKVRTSFILNSKTNLKLEAGYVYRNYRNDYGEDRTNYFYLALKSDLFNRYYDF